MTTITITSGETGESRKYELDMLSQASYGCERCHKQSTLKMVQGNKGIMCLCKECREPVNLYISDVVMRDKDKVLSLLDWIDSMNPAVMLISTKSTALQCTDTKALTVKLKEKYKMKLTKSPRIVQPIL